ncbi:MAG: hypothetical protein J5496_09735 [Lachnospiraceae bacterium]|nr:hypothetical protein [Lachnospiraceae bacterium]
MNRKTASRKHAVSVGVFAMLVFFLCLFFLKIPARADISSAEDPGEVTTAAGDEEVTTAEESTAPENTTEENTEETTEPTSPTETEPEQPDYHEAVEIPLSSPFTYGNITEDTELVFVTGDQTPINVRGGAGTEYPVVGKTRKWQSFRQLDTETDAEGKIWYKVLIELEDESYEGYISSLVSRSVYLSVGEDPFASYLILMGFPESYASRLSLVHAQYQAWFFIPTYTGIDWADALYAEANPDHAVGISLTYISKGPSSYRSMKHNNFDWEANAWKGYDGGNWTLASDELVAYFLDPRNFLSPYDDSIFLFLNLLYDGTQTEEGIRNIVRNSFMEDGKHKYGESFSYPAEFLRIGQELGISPYYLVSTVLQEVSAGGSGSVSGSYQGNLSYYSGIYNYYNIGAYTHGGMTAVESGLQWASATPAANANAYNRPWNDRIKAMEGGARYFVYNYIGRGQNTFYYKKFNVIGASLYTHQYMTNILGAYSEAVYFGRAYDASARAAILSFDIPIYNNMPEQPCPLPTKDGNPNTRLQKLTAGDAVISPQLNVNDTEYSAAVFTGTVTVLAETIDAGAQVEGAGTFDLTEGKNLITLTVTAENGDTREYHLNLWYEDPGDLTPVTSYTVQGDLISGIEPGISAAEFKENISFADGVNWILSAADGEEKTDDKLMQTGDRIQILSPNGVVWQTYTILIYGDVNGDGMIDIFDLVGVRNHIIQTAELAEISFLAGDVNRDGTVDIFDLVGVRNHIIQFALIEQ